MLNQSVVVDNRSRRRPTWVAIFAPAGTPPDVIGKLTTGIRQALDALVKRETAYWAKIIKTANITAE